MSWERHKAAERDARAARRGDAPSVLDGIATALPGLTRALKLQNRAAQVGFDWPDVAPVLDKIAEELAELRDVLENGGDRDRLADELGDVLFVYANLARHLEIDPEASLRGANAKFERRFKRIEALLAEQGRRPEQSSLAEMDRLWDQAKREERSDD